jgi:hypothetical protein
MSRARGRVCTRCGAGKSWQWRRLCPKVGKVWSACRRSLRGRCSFRATPLLQPVLASCWAAWIAEPGATPAEYSACCDTRDGPRASCDSGCPVPIISKLDSLVSPGRPEPLRERAMRRDSQSSDATTDRILAGRVCVACGSVVTAEGSVAVETPALVEPSRIVRRHLICPNSETGTPQP